MTIQKALWLSEIGAEFTVGESDIPEPGPGEVLVKLEATAINPIDWRVQREGFFLIKEYPAIIGENGSGVVTKVGDGVTNLVTGDRVTFQTAFGVKYGTFQQYCLAVAELASKVPDNVSFDETAPISATFNPFAIATYAQMPQGIAFTPPFETGGPGKYANKPIIIMGGTSSVGQYAIQLAKLSGFSPIITTASVQHKDYLLSLGATHVLDRKLPTAALKEQVTNIVGTPVMYIFDAVSLEETQQTAYDLLAPGGTLAIVNQKIVKEDETSQKKVLMVYGSFHFPPNRELGVKFAAALTRWLAEGKIKVRDVDGDDVQDSWLTEASPSIA
ncbi:chaperonin 10-like protein [Butyriboletus roseoflavus]|nr:chaperonin 10-like protein [Butyriboletus roseoflavus]